jgi:NADH-quinone oxidoreductase subunit F
MNLASKKKLEQKFSAIRDEAERRGKAFKETPIPKIRIGMATCGTASGAVETRKAFEEVLAERDIEARIHTVGCVGHCYAEPVVAIETPGFPPILYHQVTPGKARMLVKSFSRRARGYGEMWTH